MSKMKMHVYNSVDIVAAWDTKKPIAALCGDVRVLDRSEHDKRVADETPVCIDCARIASAYASTGQASPLHKLMKADELERNFRPVRNYTYTVKWGVAGVD